MPTPMIDAQACGAPLCLAASDNSRELLWLSVAQFSALHILAEFGGEGSKFSMAPIA